MISSFISHFSTPPLLLVRTYQLRTTTQTTVVKLLTDELYKEMHPSRTKSCLYKVDYV